MPYREFHNTLADVHAYMASADGQDAVRSALARRRLPGHLDVEIEEAVLGEALRFLKNGGAIDSPGGWCRARIRARAVDLVRGAIRDRRNWGVRVPLTDEIPENEPDGTDVLAGDPLEDLDGIRRHVLSTGDADTAIAGALTFISLIGEQAEPLDACPRPSTGASAEESAMWSVLWYLGIRDCFSPGNTAAKRRSRAARGVRDLLRTWGGLR